MADDTPTKWHIFARHQYLGTVLAKPLSEVLRYVGPWATVYEEGHAINVWLPPRRVRQAKEIV